MKNVIIADIDGCCLDSDARLHHYLEGDLESYHAHWHTDKSITPVVRIYRKFIEDPAYRFFFITARSSVARSYTLHQLQEHVHHSITDSMLLMRSHDYDGVPDVDLKPALLATRGISVSEVLMAFDDRTKVANMWRSYGILCLQPALNDY